MTTKFSKGALVWVRHPTEAWKPGTVGEILPKGRLKVFYADGEEEVVRTSAENPLLRTISCEGDIQLAEGTSEKDEELFSDDLTKMTQLIAPAVLQSLKKSYEQGRFYSKLGSGTVLALNPFKEAPELFTLKTIQSYHSVSLSELQDLPAHVYAAAQSALVSLRASVGRVNQSIIVSGESGAGKTWTVRCLMRYLAEVGIEYKRRLSSTDDPVSSMHVTPIRASMKHSIHDTAQHSNSPQKKIPRISDASTSSTLQNSVEDGAVNHITDVANEAGGFHGSQNPSISSESREDSMNLNVNNNKETNGPVGNCSGAGDAPGVSKMMIDDDTQNLEVVLDLDDDGGNTEDEELMEDEENDVLADMDETVEDLNTSIRIVDRIERRILHSNPILEAFGNAQTLRNENSSRFGKYIQLQYDRSGTIVGAQLRTYLLEKTRAVRHDPGEKSYHIFYQVLHGAKEEERIAWKLPESPFPEDGRDVGEEFQRTQKSDFIETRTSMLRIGILDETQEEIFKLLSAVLHLRQLTFEGSDDLQNPCILEKENRLNKESLKIAAELLCVEEEMIMQVITLREITAHSNRRKSIFYRPSTVEECYSRRDSLTKLIYEILFHWIVQRVGDSVSAPKDMWYSFIGLLDVYGFESFENNSLEQLCINYANEKLQQHFVSSFLREQQDEYSSEGVSWTECDLTDNVESLLALEAPRNSLFSLLNEECRLNRARADSQLKSRVETMFQGSKYIVQPRISAQEPSFSVVHYAGQVSYRTEDLIVKNKDEVPTEITQLLASSANQFVFDLVNGCQVTGAVESFTSTHHDTTVTPNKGKHRPTVLTRFKKSLDDLLDTLASTDCRYIRCIKPNKQSVPDVFNAQFVLSQLEACGVIETIRVCAPAHPNKLSYNEFLQRYRFLLRKDGVTELVPAMHDTPTALRKRRRRSMTNADLREDACERILKGLKRTSKIWKQNEKDPLQYGRTKIFLSSDLFEALEASRSEDIVRCASLVQRTWRMYVWRKKCRAERKAIILRREAAASVLQKAWRFNVNRRKCREQRKLLIAKRHQKAVLLQRCWVNHKRKIEARRERKILIKREESAALTIQKTFRAWRIRYKYKNLLDAWKQLRLLPEPDYRAMVERRLRHLVGPEPAISPSPSYEEIRATFEMPEVCDKDSLTLVHGTPTSGSPEAQPSTSTFTPPSVCGASTDERNNNAETLTVYYESPTLKKIAIKEKVKIQDDLEPSDNDLNRLLHSQGAYSPINGRNMPARTSTPKHGAVHSPGSLIHDNFTSKGNSSGKWTSEDDFVMTHHHLRSSTKPMRHARIVRSSSSRDMVTEKVKVQRASSFPKFPQGPGIIYAWHNRPIISVMTVKRPLSLSSDPLTLLEMQYNESTTVVTTPFSSIKLSKHIHRRRKKHHHSRKGHLTPSGIETPPYSFTWSSPRSSIPKSGSNCILKYADVPPK